MSFVHAKTIAKVNVEMSYFYQMIIACLSECPISSYHMERESRYNNCLWAAIAFWIYSGQIANCLLPLTLTNFQSLAYKSGYGQKFELTLSNIKPCM